MPCAGDLALDPLARIFVAVGQPVGAGAVLAAVHEGAFVDAAVVILLGDDSRRPARMRASARAATRSGSRAGASTNPRASRSGRVSGRAVPCQGFWQQTWGPQRPRDHFPSGRSLLERGGCSGGPAMTDRFRLTLAQLNPTVGDIAGNIARAQAAWEAGQGRRRRHGGADRDVRDRLPDAGPDPEARLRDCARWRRSRRWPRDCADGPALGIGGPVPQGGKLYNAYYVLQGGRVARRAS